MTDTERIYYWIKSINDQNKLIQYYSVGYEYNNLYVYINSKKTNLFYKYCKSIFNQFEFSINTTIVHKGFDNQYDAITLTIGNKLTNE